MKSQRPDTGMLGEERRELETRSTFGSSEEARVAPGASWDVRRRGVALFSSSPRSPLLHERPSVRWPIDADAPWKSHGRLRRTARTEPSTAFSTELGKPANGRRFPTSVNRPAALRRAGVRSVSLFPTNGTYNRQSDAGDTINPSTQSGQAQSLSHAPSASAQHTRQQRAMSHTRLLGYKVRVR